MLIIDLVDIAVATHGHDRQVRVTGFDRAAALHRLRVGQPVIQYDYMRAHPIDSREKIKVGFQ